jgi:Helix-turn-helix domain
VDDRRHSRRHSGAGLHRRGEFGGDRSDRPDSLWPEREGQGVWRRHGESAGGAQAVLWTFHNAKSGLCYPGYERIAEAAGCARSTVAEAIKALEDAGIMSWVHRLKRVRLPCADLFGESSGSRIVPQRTSNAYHFTDPGMPAGRLNSPESDFPSGTPNQVYFSSFVAAYGSERTGRSGRKEAQQGEGSQNPLPTGSSDLGERQRPALAAADSLVGARLRSGQSHAGASDGSG